MCMQKDIKERVDRSMNFVCTCKHFVSVCLTLLLSSLLRVALFIDEESALEDHHLQTRDQMFKLLLVLHMQING